MCQTADSGLHSAPTRAVALCSALELPVNKVQAASCKCQMLATFTSLQVKELPTLTRKYSTDSFLIFLDSPFLILRSAKMTREPENIFTALCATLLGTQSRKTNILWKPIFTKRKPQVRGWRWQCHKENQISVRPHFVVGTFHMFHTSGFLITLMKHLQKVQWNRKVKLFSLTRSSNQVLEQALVRKHQVTKKVQRDLLSF